MRVVWRYLCLFSCLISVTGLVYADCDHSKTKGEAGISNSIEIPEAKASKQKQPDIKPEKIQMGKQKVDTKPDGQKALNLDDLIVRLKETKAIGIFTKLAIRSDVIDLRDALEEQKKKNTLQTNLGTLRNRFDGLLLKIMALLEKDRELSREIYLAREMIWSSLLEVKT